MNAEEIAEDVDTIRNDVHSVVTGMKYLIGKLERRPGVSLSAVRIKKMVEKLERMEDQLNEEYVLWIDEADND